MHATELLTPDRQEAEGVGVPEVLFRHEWEIGEPFEWGAAGEPGGVKGVRRQTLAERSPPSLL